MQEITYINTYGESITFTKGYPFYLHSIDASSLSTTRGSIKSIGQDGETTQSITFNPRIIVAELGFGGRTGNQMDWRKMRENWAKICRVFLPKQTGTLIYRNEGGVYQIECTPIELPNYQKVVGAFNRFTIDFQADSPLWLSQFQFENRLGQVVGGKRYPLRYPLRFGTWVKDATVMNDTNYPTPIEVTIESTAEFITLTNETTGEFIRVDTPLTSGQRMVINTGKQTVIVQTLDALGKVTAWEYANYKVSIDSDYFKLVPGKNYITIENGYPGQIPTAFIRYHKMFLGV